MSEVTYIVSVSPVPEPVNVIVQPADTVYAVQQLPAETQVVTSFRAGPPGLRGPAGSGSDITYKAAGNLSGHRVMRSTGNGFCDYADAANVAHAALVVGISSSAVVTGADVSVQNSGRMTEPSWTWVPELPVFCGSMGVLTQTPPTTGFQIILGVAEDATSIIIKLSNPLILA